jgi:hypothetical protein
MPLERKLIGRLLCAVQRGLIVTGITAGVVPASATAGMLLGYGIRGGSPARVFAAIGALIVGSRGGAFPTLLGVIMHVALMILCGVLYTALTNGARENPFAWAIAIGAGVAAITFVLVRAFGGSIALVLTPGNLVAVGVVIALTLPVGMRFAFSRM